METVVEVEGNVEPKFEDSAVAKTSSAPNSLKLIADPIVYHLVRVEGDGRLVPATNDEVMEVEDLLEDDKSEMRFLADNGGTIECTPNNKFSSDKAHLKGSEGMFQSENLEVDAEKSNVVLDSAVGLGKPNTQIQKIVPSWAPSTNDSRIDQSRGGECSNPQGGGVTESGSKLKGEICLDNLSVRELHETFKATFGRETSVKDKLWLKRRIAMGLTNSSDVSTTTSIIEGNRVVKKGKEESSKSVDGKHANDPVVGAMEENCGGSSSGPKKQMENHLNDSGKRLEFPSLEYNHHSEDPCMEQRAVKRVRKPTRRYIEEVSEGESRENSGKITSPVKNSGHGQSSPRTRVRPVQDVRSDGKLLVTSLDSLGGSGIQIPYVSRVQTGQSSPQTRVQPVQNVRSDGRLLVTRQDSLGGSGIQIPYVSRVRRGRPRENFMALMKLQPSGMGMAARLVKKAFGVCDSQPDNERGNKVFKTRLAPGWVQQPHITKAEKAEEYLERKTELDKDDVLLQHMDSSSDNSDDNIVTVPTAKGGLRRKHHRPWTLSEVVKLVEGVARYGAGRWSEIKRISFASYSHRTSVDLKDKWRNLLRASYAQLPADKVMENSRKHASIPIPAPILVRVRELAEMQAQVPPNLSGGKFAGHSGRSVHETRSGYL